MVRHTYDHDEHGQWHAKLLPERLWRLVTELLAGHGQHLRKRHQTARIDQLAQHLLQHMEQEKTSHLLANALGIMEPEGENNCAGRHGNELVDAGLAALFVFPLAL